MALVKAEAIIHNHFDAAELHLEELGLTSIDSLLPLLAKMPRLTSLHLARNEMAGLPADLSSLSHVAYIDLSGNPIHGLSTVLPGLQSLEQLRELKLELPFETEEDELIVSLPSLEALNGTQLNGDDGDTGDEAHASTEERTENGYSATGPSATSAEHDKDATRWSAADTKAIEQLFADVTQASGSTQHADEFTDYTSRVVRHVTCLTAAEEDPFSREGEVLKARRLLMEYCQEQVVGAVSRANPLLGKGVEAVLRYSSGLFDQYDTHWRRTVQDRDARLTLMKRDMQEAIAEIESLMAQVAANGSTRESTGVGRNTAPATAVVPEPRSDRRAHGSSEAVHLSRTPRTGRQTTPRGVLNDSSAHRSAERSQNRGSVPTVKKVLTLKQLKEVIEEMYVSKTKYDAKCRQNHLPRETMEQHMYTYLNQRYGLKDIILEWVTAVLEGVKRYAVHDNDVAVFGKILRNEVDEEFRYVQRQVRETVRELLRAGIKKKKPLKSDLEVNRLVHNKMEGTLLESEWTDIVRYMYNDADARSIIELLRKELYQQSMPLRHRSQGKKEAEMTQLSYNDFLLVLLDFQLDGHERFLVPYVRLFRQYDTDRNGIVSDYEFASIVRAMDPAKTQEEAEAMVSLIDPYGSQLITFSESVTFLSDELVKLSERYAAQ